MTAPIAHGRRLLMLILALLVVGGAGLLWSSSLVWSVLVVAREAPLPSVAYSLDGADAAPMVLALGLVALAAVVAILATGPIGRRIIGGVVFATAVFTAVQVYEYVASSTDEHSQVITEDGAKHAVDEAPEASNFAGVLALAGVVITGVTGFGLMMTARRLPRMGAKYERPEKKAKRKDDIDGSVRDRDMWSSLDRGEDPTD